MNQPAETAVLYSAVLRPHRSAGRKAARVVTRMVAALLAIVGTGFLAGAWPVLPFLGLEIVLLYALLRSNQHAGNACEAINLTRKALTIRRLDHWGKQSDFSFPPYWLQVNLLEMPGWDGWNCARKAARSPSPASFCRTNAASWRRPCAARWGGGHHLAACLIPPLTPPGSRVE